MYLLTDLYRQFTCVPVDRPVPPVYLCTVYLLTDLYRQFTSLKKRNPELKTLLAVGGWTLGSGPFSRMAGSKEGRRNFVEHALQYLRTHHFDGLDLDWEYPANRGSPPEDKDNFSLLLKVGF